MNLRQMIDMAGAILDYSPGVTIYENEVRRFLNESYLDLYADRAWNFAQKSTLLTIRADRTAANGTVTGATTVGIAAGTFFTADMAGMIIEISGATNSADDGEYEILAVDTTATTSAVLVTINGNTPTLSGAGTARFKVKQRYVDLPSDTIEVLSLGIRSPQNERQEWMYLNRWLDEHLALDIDLVSRPTDWVMYDEYVVPQPRVTPTLIPALGSGPSPIGGVYDVCYTFIRQNRESAPSPVSATATVANPAVDTIGAGSLQVTTGAALLKRLYFRCSLSNRFYRAAATDATAAATVTGPVTFQNITTFIVNSEPLPEHEGRYKRLRPYPRQDQDYEATLRYVYRPPRLLDDSDAPEFPAAFHRYLVYRTCQELFVKHNNLPQSEMYRIKSEDELMRMQQRCLTQSANTWIKSSFRQSAIYRRPRPRLTHN
jgi:hypothetical protein